MASSETYELRRDGHSYVMAAANLTITNIGLVFGVSWLTFRCCHPSGLILCVCVCVFQKLQLAPWLKEVNGSRCYFPIGEAFEIGEFALCFACKGVSYIISNSSSRQCSVYRTRQLHYTRFINERISTT